MMLKDPKLEINIVFWEFCNKFGCITPANYPEILYYKSLTPLFGAVSPNSMSLQSVVVCAMPLKGRSNFEVNAVDVLCKGQISFE